MKNYCYKCKDRVIGCHSNCIKYKQYVIELKKLKLNKELINNIELLSSRCYYKRKDF